MLDAANVSPLDVSYIEMHGTGTQAGDAVEMSSVLDVFAPGQRGPEHPLHLGSVKANVGHSESGSGVTSLIKVLKMMENDEIPPHCGIKTKINHNFPTDLKARNVNIALEPTSWKRPKNGDGKRKVFLNNFSAAGGNTALLLEDAPAAVSLDHLDTRSYHLVAVSGKTRSSIQRNIEALVAFIDANPQLSLLSLAYTSTARRMHLNHRVVAGGYDLRSIRDTLAHDDSCGDVKPIPIPSKLPNVSFVYTGQGALYTGLARQFFRDISLFRANVQRLDTMTQNQGFPSFLPLIDGTLTSLENVDIVVSHVGTSCVQMALTQLWLSWGISPSVVIGHSLGEYAALYAEGVLDASDVIFLAGTRARLLNEHCSIGTHSMLAVKASISLISPYMNEARCEIACINGPQDTVISGTTTEIDSLSRNLGTQQIKTTKLDMPFAFHSSQVDNILQDFESAARSVTFEKPSIPYLSPLSAGIIVDKSELGPSYLARACRATVNFQGALLAAQKAGIISDGDIWLEVGAHPVCSSFVKSTLGSHNPTLSTLRSNGDAWKVVAESLSALYLAGIDLNWDQYHRQFRGALKVLKLPTYRWDSKNYWIQYNNNFCLSKGDAPATIADATESVVSSLSTTSVQRVIEQQLTAEKSTITIESDLKHPVLSSVLQEHAVNGAALCPSVRTYPDSAFKVLTLLVSIRRYSADDCQLPISGIK